MKNQTYFFYFFTSFSLLLLLSINLVAQDRNISINEVYPDDFFKENGGKFINVKNLVAAGIYHTNAVGDGVADDSDAIIAAMTWVQDRLKAHYVNVQPVQVHWQELWTIYLPNGTYRVTKPLVYGGGRVPDPLRLDHADREGSQKIILVGQSRENTIIKLDNNASGFQSGGYKPVVAFSRFDLSPPTIFNNMPSGNQIRNITIDTGTGNPNAIGLDFCGANTSRLDNIKVKGSGRIGIHMRTGTVAGYQSNVTVEGFDYGIYMAGYSVNHAVFEYVTLVNQNISAVYLTIASASMRKVHSTNSVTGVIIEKTSSLTPHMVITDSEFTGGSSSSNVFDISNGHLFARNITVGGYGITVSKNGNTINSGSLQEYVSDSITAYSNERVRSSAIKSMNLPVLEYPIVQWESNLSQWANVHDFGAVGNGTTDDRAAIQAAMNSGKSVVYFPKMRYHTSGSVTVPSTVKQIIGSNIQILGSGDKFVVSQASPNVLLFHYINFRGGGAIRHSAQRDILMESTHSHGNVYVSDLTERGSKLYINNGLGFARSSDVVKNIDVWNRWNNNEKHAHYQFNIGPGCNIWMMGFKSEGTYSVFDVQGGSRLEVLGGVMSRFGRIPPDAPAIGIRNVNSHISIIANTQGPNRNWDPIIQDIQGDTTKSWKMNQFPGRSIDANIVIPLYVSYHPDSIPSPGELIDKVFIESPVSGERFGLDEDINVVVNVTLAEEIQSVELYANDSLINQKTSLPWEFDFSTGTEGMYYIKAKVTGETVELITDSLLIYVYDPRLTEVGIIPKSDTIMQLMDSIPLNYYSHDQFGFDIESTPTWSSSIGGIITDANYFKAPGDTGTYEAYLQIDELRDTMIITVYQPELNSLKIEPQNITVAFHEIILLTGRGFDQYGVPVAGIDVSWHVLDSCGSIDENGTYTAGDEETVCFVVAESGELTDTVSINVVPLSETVELFHNITGVWGEVPIEQQAAYLYDTNTSTFPDITEPAGGGGAYIGLRQPFPVVLQGISYYGRSDKPPGDPVYTRPVGTLFDVSVDTITKGYKTVGIIETVKHSEWVSLELNSDISAVYLRTLFNFGSFGNLAEVSFITTPLIHNIETVWGGAPSPFNSPLFAGAAIFDGDTTTYPDITGPTADSYVGYMFHEPRIIGSVRIFPRSDKVPSDPIFKRPVGSKIQASIDGINWLTLHTLVEDDFSHSQWTNIPIEDQTEYNFGRILFSEGSSGNLSELQFIKYVELTGLELPEFISMDAGTTHQLHVIYLPNNATEKYVTWSSSNDDIATVDKNGLVTAISQGEATITATTEDGGILASCLVTVLITNINPDKQIDKPRFYPNPALSHIYISNADNVKRVSLFDLLGREVLSNSSMEAANSMHLNIEALVRGIYVLIIYETNGMNHTYRLIAN